MRTAFIYVLALAGSLVSSVIAAPSADATAITKRAEYVPTIDALTAQIKPDIAAINSLSDSVKPSTSAEDKATKKSSVASHFESIMTAVNAANAKLYPTTIEKVAKRQTEVLQAVWSVARLLEPLGAAIDKAGDAFGADAVRDLVASLRAGLSELTGSIVPKLPLQLQN